MEETAKIGNFRLSDSYSYTPHSQGVVERFQKTIGRILRKWAFEFQNVSWDELLPAALFAYRASIHHSTRFSPFNLLYGRDPAVPFEIGQPAKPPIVSSEQFDNYATELAKRMIVVWDKA